MFTLRLSNLAILAIEHHIHFDIDDCVKDFALKKTRRVYLRGPLFVQGCNLSFGLRSVHRFAHCIKVFQLNFT